MKMRKIQSINMRKYRIANRIAIFDLEQNDTSLENELKEMSYLDEAYSFSTSDGTIYRVVFSPGSATNRDAADEWQVYFNFIDPESGVPHYDIVGGKQVFEVFKNVLSIIREWLRTHPHVRLLWFGANLDQPSRVKLYESLVKKFIGPNYTQKTLVGSLFFIIENPFYEPKREARLALFDSMNDPYTNISKSRFVEYDFTTSDGTEYQFMAGPRYNAKDPTEWSAAFATEGGFSILGDKKAFEVMQHIVSIVSQLFKENPTDISELGFSSKEKSRTSLYSKILNRFGMAFDVMPSSEGDYFYVKNPYYSEVQNETE
jgi:hypothetical protein